MKIFNLTVLVSFFAIGLNVSIANGQNEIDAIEKLEVRGALVSTRFNSLDELRKVVDIKYITTPTGGTAAFLKHKSNGKEVISLLKEGVSEKDFEAARDGGFLERLKLLFNSPFSVYKKNELKAVSTLARRKPDWFGEGDPAFYDLSQHILKNIEEDDLAHLDSIDLASDKGYFNTINHITAQVFMTALFSERVADLVADAHERKNLPELTHGSFTEKQLTDLKTGPVDNYVDMINNEWGQELGKELQEKHNITSKTKWTEEFLALFLNEIQRYYCWSFQIGFKPFRPNDDVVRKFSFKLKKVLGEQ